MLPLRFRSRWLAAGALVLLGTFAAAMVPSHWFSSSSGGPGLPHTDKVLHAVVFAVLALWFSGQLARRHYARMTFALLAFGILIELCQRSLHYRTADTLDFVADAAGVAVGIGIALSGAGGWSLRLEQWYLQRRGAA